MRRSTARSRGATGMDSSVAVHSCPKVRGPPPSTHASSSIFSDNQSVKPGPSPSATCRPVQMPKLFAVTSRVRTRIDAEEHSGDEPDRREEEPDRNDDEGCSCRLLGAEEDGGDTGRNAEQAGEGERAHCRTDDCECSVSLRRGGCQHQAQHRSRVGLRLEQSHQPAICELAGHIAQPVKRASRSAMFCRGTQRGTDRPCGRAAKTAEPVGLAERDEHPGVHDAGGDATLHNDVAFQRRRTGGGGRCRVRACHVVSLARGRAPDLG